MASASRGRRVRSSNRTVLLSEHLGMGSTDGCGEIEDGRWDSNDDMLLPRKDRFSGVSNNRLVVSVGLRRYLRRRKEKEKMMRNGDNADNNELKRRDPFSSGCLRLYARRGGCKVVSCEEVEVEADNRRRSSDTEEECMPHNPLLIIEKTGLECFSHGFSETIRKKRVVKEKEVERAKPCGNARFSLPDDVMEMCLLRLPITALMTARLVCKKWRFLTTTPHFLRLRSEEGLHQSPCLFMFGITKDDSSASEVYALDISMDKWHRVNADALKGRTFFSVASVGTDLYVIGGCSSLNEYSPARQWGYLKTHKGVFVFSPLRGSWCRAASMNSARASPVLGVFEVSSSCTVFDNQPERPLQRSRVGGVSDIYQDPHRCSVRRQLRDAFSDNETCPVYKEKPLIGWERNNGKKFALIAVGGRGSWDEPLDSGEIYDCLTNRWISIAKLPGDFGTACSGAVCRGVFYVYSETDKLAGYNLERDMWFPIQTHHPPPRLREYHPLLICCNNQLFMLSVTWPDRHRMLNVGEKVVRKLWELNHTPFSWTEVSRHPDAPMDCNADFVADSDRIYGVEMFKIFGQVMDFLTVCDVSLNKRTKWSRLSRHRVAYGAHASSLFTKKLAILHL